MPTCMLTCYIRLSDIFIGDDDDNLWLTPLAQRCNAQLQISNFSKSIASANTPAIQLQAPHKSSIKFEDDNGITMQTLSESYQPVQPVIVEKADLIKHFCRESRWRSDDMKDGKIGGNNSHVQLGSEEEKASKGRNVKSFKKNFVRSSHESGRSAINSGMMDKVLPKESERELQVIGDSSYCIVVTVP